MFTVLLSVKSTKSSEVLCTHAMFVICPTSLYYDKEIKNVHIVYNNSYSVYCKLLGAYDRAQKMIYDQECPHQMFFNLCIFFLSHIYMFFFFARLCPFLTLSFVYRTWSFLYMYWNDLAK